MWEPLGVGDLVDVVAPGMGCSKDVLVRAREFLENWGLQTRWAKDIFGKDTLCANSLERRLKHLRFALKAEDSKAIWCLRGGYGSSQLVNSLGVKAFPGKAKVFIGLSDITSLHHHFLQNQKWCTLHGPNLKRLALGEASAKEKSFLKKVLFGQKSHIDFSLKALNPEALKPRAWSAPLTGGNLATCASLVGTRYQIDCRGQFLFLEDIGERGYQVERMLYQLEWSGVFKGVRGLLFGDFIGGGEPGGRPSRVTRVLKGFAQRQKFPVFTGAPSGHGRVQMPLPFGTLGQVWGGPKAKASFPMGFKARKGNH